ncbi:RHS family protein [Pectobacterium parmentieri]|uniref:RHS family protein n=1 Tax=Pectobacterium parmentieri TaxID=1905730 RepID=A0A0H3I950_PECPM|nr:RHS family protein [Pectobacterium parmentieri]
MAGWIYHCARRIPRCNNVMFLLIIIKIMPSVSVPWSTVFWRRCNLPGSRDACHHWVSVHTSHCSSAIPRRRRAAAQQRRSNGCGFSLRHEWSPTGLLQRQALEGADGRVNDVLERRYQYDVLDRLTGISDSHWGEQAFRLNGAGQVTAERRDEGRRRQARLFGYDSEQNLCEVSQIAPGLAQTLKVQDAVVQASARYDAAGRVVERGHTQYQYDDCGRLAIKRETRPGFRPKETHFDWDVQDRLVRVSLPDGARWRYRYDVFGRRINKVREGQVPSAQAVARVAYRWDGDQLIGQQQYRADGSAAREVQWVYEPGSFRPLAQVEVQGGGTQLHNIVTDQAGTARELCSEEGDVHWRGEQGLWGAHREERRPALSGGCGKRRSVLLTALSGTVVRCRNGVLLQPASLL